MRKGEKKDRIGQTAFMKSLDCILLGTAIGSLSYPLERIGVRCKDYGRGLIQNFPEESPQFQKGEWWIECGRIALQTSDFILLNAAVLIFSGFDSSLRGGGSSLYRHSIELLSEEF